MDFGGKIIKMHNAKAYYKFGCATIQLVDGRYLTPVHRVTKQPLRVNKYSLRYANAVSKFIQCKDKELYRVTHPTT